MRFFENGYEKVSIDELRGASEISVRFLTDVPTLFMIGSEEDKRRAALYLKRGINFCHCAADEFTLHFLCEQSCGVRIVRAEPRLLSA